MKILLINKFFHIKGGADNSYFATAQLLEKRGNEIIFFSMKHEKNFPTEYEKYFVSNVDYDKRGFLCQAKAAGRLLYSFEAKRGLEKLIEDEKPDIAHLNIFAHQISPSILHVLKEYNIPTVMTMREYKLVCPTYLMLLNGKACEKCKKGRYYECFINKCTRKSYVKSLVNTVEMYLHHEILHIYDLIDVFISPSQFLKDKCAEMGMKNTIHHLPNFVIIEDYDPQYSWSDNAITYFGRLSEEKGLFTLIDSVKGLEVKVKIIGDGPLKDDLILRTKKLGVDNVAFLGYLQGETLKEEVRNSMFVVLPSEWYENNPRTIIEGFALGKPAIGARIGGIPELVRDYETGMTFEPRSVQDLHAKIEYMINRADRIPEMGMNARKFVEQKLNAEKHYERLMEIYQEAINKHK